MLRSLAVLSADLAALGFCAAVFKVTGEPRCFAAAALCAIGAVLIAWDLVTQ